MSIRGSYHMTCGHCGTPKKKSVKKTAKKKVKKK